MFSGATVSVLMRGVGGVSNARCSSGLDGGIEMGSSKVGEDDDQEEEEVMLVGAL